MSDYYDLSKPYRREDDWNKLVMDTNEILQNPPADTDCDPIPEIDLAEENHIWTKADIQEVRDALSQTCPDISFSTELNLWEPDPIDEIEIEMDKAWCDCEPISQVTCTDLDYTVSPSTIEACPDPARCCGATYYYWFNVLCPEIWSSEDIYTSPQFSLYKCINAAKNSSYAAQYSIAWAQSHRFASLWDDLIYLKGEINDKQRDIDDKVNEVDVAIAAYEGCLVVHPEDPEFCDGLKTAICLPGVLARQYADELQILLDQFSDLKIDLDGCKSMADGAATAALAIIMTYQVDRAGDENLSSQLAGFLSTGNVAWADLIDPRSDNAVKQVPIPIISVSDVSNTVVPKCRVYKWTYWGQLGKQSLYAEISPGGIPYWSSIQILTNVVNWYFLKTVTWSCDNWAGQYCDCGAIACDICPPTFWWCGGFLWDACDPSSGSYLCSTMDELQDYIDATMKAPNGLGGKMCTSGISSKVQEQADFFALYLDWYTTHLEYDDRHEPYC